MHQDKATLSQSSTHAPNPVPHRGPHAEHYQRIALDGTETRASLLARGLPYRTVTTALKRGWYTVNYHTPQYPQEDGPGHFALLTNPYAFATAQVRHVLDERCPGTVTPEQREDAIQDALLWCWERRHCTHIQDWLGYMATVIREKLRKNLGNSVQRWHTTGQVS